jgi:hypothetical protein
MQGRALRATMREDVSKHMSAMHCVRELGAAVAKDRMSFFWSPDRSWVFLDSHFFLHCPVR